MKLWSSIGLATMLFFAATPVSSQESTPVKGDSAKTADGKAEASPAEAIPNLVTKKWEEPPVPLDPVWNLLLLPERMIEVLFAPVSGAVSLVETYRLDKRIVDALTNEAGTFKVTPKVKYGGVDGIGLGAAVTYRGFWGGDERWDISGLYRTNGDNQFKTRYQQSFARLEGRLLELLGEYEIDSNEPFYGIGGDTVQEDRRVLKVETLGADGALDINAMGSLLFTGKLLFGFRRLRFSPGSDLNRIPVGEAGDEVVPPPGFEDLLHFPRLGFQVQYDTRDRQGRPTDGTVARLNTAVTSDINGADLNAVRGELTVSRVVQLLPIYRILVLTAGVGGAVPLEEDAEVPFQELITLGRQTFLRGYNRDRFKGQYGWWAVAQYQFPVAEYMNSGVALDAALFLDTGRVGTKPSELLDRDIRYSYGLGLGVAHTTKSYVSATLALSPEGFEFFFSGGLEL